MAVRNDTPSRPPGVGLVRQRVCAAQKSDPRGSAYEKQSGSNVQQASCGATVLFWVAQKVRGQRISSFSRKGLSGSGE